MQCDSTQLSNSKPENHRHSSTAFRFRRIVGVMLSLMGPVALCGGLSAIVSGCDRTPALPVAYRALSTLALPAGDSSAGNLVFRNECEKCHQLTPGKNFKGPQLMNIYGAKAAALSDYTRYSQALKTSHWTWDQPTLQRYLADPGGALPHGKMLYDGLLDAKERQDVIAYLATLRSPVPISKTVTPQS